MNKQSPPPSTASHPTTRPDGQVPAASGRSAPQSTGDGPVALWQQLAEVSAALHAIRGGQSGTAALAAVPPSLRPGVQSLLFQVLRQAGRAEALRGRMAPRTPPPAADALLCTALALCWDPEHAPYEPFTLVNQTVEAAKRQPAIRAQAAFINGCLRRFLREREDLVALTDSDPLALWNHPRWWIDRLRKDHPRDWERILIANNAHAPMTLRVNVQKCTVVQYQRLLDAINFRALSVGESGLVLEKPVPVHVLPGFAQGLVSVQDAAAQRAAGLLLDGLDMSAPLHVLDACAAPGGKTAHLLERAGSEPLLNLTALEVDPARASRINETLERLGLRANVVVADAARPETWWQQHCGGMRFDAILLDAPCTASGIVRRHPDVRWLRRPSDMAQLAGTQASLLNALWPLVRPGGRLLYCTCSVFRAEGDEQIQTFLAHNTDAVLLPSPGHLIPSIGAAPASVPDNPEGDHDGFFYALLQKSGQ